MVTMERKENEVRSNHRNNADAAVSKHGRSKHTEKRERVRAELELASNLV